MPEGRTGTGNSWHDHQRIIVVGNTGNHKGQPGRADTHTAKWQQRHTLAIYRKSLPALIPLAYQGFAK